MLQLQNTMPQTGYSLAEGWYRAFTVPYFAEKCGFLAGRNEKWESTKTTKPYRIIRKVETNKEYRGVSSSSKNKVKSSRSKLRARWGSGVSTDMVQDIKATKEAQRRKMATLQDQKPAHSKEWQRSILLVWLTTARADTNLLIALGMQQVSNKSLLDAHKLCHNSAFKALPGKRCSNKSNQVKKKSEGYTASPSKTPSPLPRTAELPAVSRNRMQCPQLK